jgi:hypothetical protein
MPDLEKVLDHIAELCHECEPHGVPMAQCIDEILRIAVTRDVEGHIKDCDGPFCEDGKVWMGESEEETHEPRECPVCKGIGIVQA